MRELDVDRKMMVRIADLLVKRNSDCAVLLKNREGDVVCMTGVSSKANAAELVSERLKGQDFKGGGSKRSAQGRITRK